MRHRLVATAAALLVVVAACGDDDSPLPSAPAADEPAALAAYLAEVYDTTAQLTSDQSAPEAAFDPSIGLAALDEALAAWTALTPPAEAADFHETLLDLNSEIRDLFAEFALATDSGDAVVIEQAANAMLTDIGLLSADIASSDADQRTLAMSALAAHPGDGQAEYLMHVLDLQDEIDLENLFSAFGTSDTDPTQMLTTVNDMLDQLEKAADRWERLEAPERFASLQEDQVRLARDLGELFDDLLSEAVSGESPSFSLLLELQELATEGPQLNVQWARGIAEVMRRLAGS